MSDGIPFRPLGKAEFDATYPGREHRIDPLTNGAILTDTQFRIALAPARAEARVVALEKSVRKAQVDALTASTQQGKIHIQIKAGFAAERHLELEPAELALLYSMLDMFIQNLPRVDVKPA